MRTLTLIGTMLTALLFTGVAHPEPDNDPRIRQHLRDGQVGRHTAFAVLAADFRNEQQSQPEVAWQIVRQKMQLEERSARDFLARLAMAADELDKAHNKAFLEFLCGQDSPRERERMAAALDTWDDLIGVTDHNAYTEFVSRLDKQQAQQLNAWLDEYKEGAQEIKLRHDQVFRAEDDVVGYVDMICANLRGAKS